MDVDKMSLRQLDNTDVETEDLTEDKVDEATSVAICKSERGKADLIYGISDRPPWIMSIVLALQHFSSSFTACIVLPVLLSKSLCFDKDQELLTKLIATSFFTTGFGTILQAFIGCRLPILQGPSAAYLIPLITMLKVRGDCPEISTANATVVEKTVLREEALSRMQEVQGVMIFAAFVQSLIGFTGLVGVILRFVGPITIGVTIFTIGISIIRVAMNLVEDHWLISIPTISLAIIFSTVLCDVNVPLPGRKRIRLFALFPVMLALVIMWFVCLILTVAGVFPEDPDTYGYAARVDTKLDNLKSSPWFSFPYPGQWGMPVFSIAGFIGVLTGVLASMMDSIGDYHACAQVACVPPPPVHAINRGIGIEGISCLVGALYGAGVGVTSHSSDIAVLKLTRVASRTVLILSGFIFAGVAFFTKFSALMNGIPTPVLGVSAVVIGMISAIGLANFQQVNMENSRNILVVGISIFTAIGIPTYIDKNPQAINTGFQEFNQLAVVLLSNKMFVGAVVSAFLDNLLPGTPEDRGMNWREYLSESNTSNKSLSSYQLPFATEWIKSKMWMKNIPFSPTFSGFGKSPDPENSSV